jgi:hypothetical protein
MRNELNKTGCSVGITGGNDLLSTPLRRWHDIPSKIMKIGSGIQVILRLFVQQPERLEW